MSVGGLEYAAGAGGLISLSLTLFRGCVQGFEIIQLAAHAGSEADNFRCKLEVEHASAITPPKTGFGKLLSKLRPDFPLASSRIIHESNGSIKKLKWAVFDRTKAANLVKDIVHFNNCLHSLLDNVNQDFVASALGSVLRDIISHSNATSELEVIKQLLSSSHIAAPTALASAASLKQIRLVLGLGPSDNSSEQSAQRAPPEGIKIKLIQLKPHLLQRETPRLLPNERELARYRSNPVLIEWKFIDRAHEKELKTRVDQLAILLANTYDASFHSLHCIGYLPKDVSYQPDDESLICYGLVFELTISASIPPRIAPAIRPLSTLFADARKPSLNERRDIALALAETVLQLHTSGWLHKGIRSDNVLYIDIGDSKWEYSNANGPFLAGYEYARPTTAHTEAMPAIPEHEIYHHPKRQGLTRANFRRSFDLFALGCVLLEVGLWSGLSEILQRVPLELTKQGHQSKASAIRPGKVDWVRLQSAKTKLLQNDDFEERSDLGGIAFYAGKIFQDVILLCLYADDEDPLDEDIGVQKEIVDLLRNSRY
ncbi:MAG: hypothetical protein Q9221_001990 [Calogaya cf. arnoldii]